MFVLVAVAVGGGVGCEFMVPGHLHVQHVHQGAQHHAGQQHAAEQSAEGQSKSLTLL